MNTVDKMLKEIDTCLRTLLPPIHRHSTRPNPAEACESCVMSEADKRHAAGLMRVNHSGEVCAQALYQGQALTAKHTALQAQLREAANEEVEHLAWCEARLQALDASPSVLNPMWYMMSFILGAGAGFLGDAVSLGFVAEIERQVEAHLATHLALLPAQDLQSRAVVSQMKRDEAAHAQYAIEAGGMLFPQWVKRLMQCSAKAMTRMSYYL